MDEQQVTGTPNQNNHDQHNQPSHPTSPQDAAPASQHRQRASLPGRPNAAARHAKRLTLNFPISVQPPISQSGSESSSPSPAVMRPFNSGSTIPPQRATTSPSLLSEPPGEGGGQLLTAIAAQERKVLELKEELEKAEAELASLKKQWATEEQGRKDTQIVHHAEALKPLRQSRMLAREEGLLGDGDMRRSIDRMSVDLRRQNSISRSSIDSPNGSEGMSVSARGRTVFQSSRHARTLSLLSSASVPNQKPVTQVETGDLRRGSRYPRSATLPSMERDANQSVGASTATASQTEKAMWRKSLPPIAQDPATEAIMRTGRQMVSDFREGLWTFVEDLRQATVGDDSPASQGQLIRRASGQSSTSSSRERPSGLRNRTANGLTRSSSSGKTPTATHQEISFWSEFGIDAPEQTQPASGQGQDDQKNNDESSLLDFDDSWDDWDAPPPPQQQRQQHAKSHTPSSSSSTFPKRDQSPSTNVSSPRTSTSLTDIIPPQNEPAEKSKRNSIPWPALNKLHPSKLTRTASNLMDEWEKSLASPEERTPRTATPAAKND